LPIANFRLPIFGVGTGAVNDDLSGFQLAIGNWKSEMKEDGKYE
jgi:hypothetical protein